ncbi:probable mitochondrial import inner membrane translocase subunit tin-44 [Neocloeon triangulifer]|uniref:probable mitochondrial import inner membrane translocase subunit tin-44 n=1 Tax=Neocloeon triangulifer TaxID=2078957 RepID=UPI00286F531D|nr:probable mitochondrial import inner membrane translocase subunit tin-44 [Neocloeon triangulifer]
MHCTLDCSFGNMSHQDQAEEKKELVRILKQGKRDLQKEDEEVEEERARLNSFQKKLEERDAVLTAEKRELEKDKETWPAHEKKIRELSDSQPDMETELDRRERRLAKERAEFKARKEAEKAAASPNN